MGPICLQGGAEFQRGCESMDVAVLSAAPSRGGDGPRVVIAPFAGRAGREREIAGANGRRWYAGLGARPPVVVLDEAEPFAEALADPQPTLLVLPGGSPARLLAALQPHRLALADFVRRGGAVSGASAGAMVLCRWTVLPEARPHVVAGLAVADVDIVLPHYRGNTAWLNGARQVLPSDAVALGLPERSGILLRSGGSREALGVEPYVTIALDGADA